ncbi:MAG: hypothetical protein QM664_01035 [Flavihumibacter sp.]
MELFEAQIACCLEQLRLGAALSFSRGGSKWVCCSLAGASLVFSPGPVPALLPENTTNVTVLIGDARSVLTYMAAPEPGIFELLETPGSRVTARTDAVVGLPEELSDLFAEVDFLLPEDDFQKSLVKRFQQPLLLLPVAQVSSKATLYDVETIAC